VHDLDFGEVYQRLTLSRPNCEGMDDLHLQNGILYHFNALCIPKGERVGLIRDAHPSDIFGHFVVGKIIYDLQRYVYWTKMQEQVAKYIRGILYIA